MRSKAAMPSIIACVCWFLVSCENAAPSIFIESVIPATKECKYELDSAWYIPKGYYDAYCGKNYNIMVRVVSMMRPRADSTRPRPETNEVQFTRAEVLLTTPQGTEVAPRFSTPVASSVAPGDSSKPGKALVQIEIVPKPIVRQVRKYDQNEILSASITLFGETVGGTEVESDEFIFPFEVCDACATISTANADCTLSEDQQNVLDDLDSCQNGRGFDGSFCFYCPATDEVL